MLKQIRFICQLFREGDQIVSSFGDTPEEAETALCEYVCFIREKFK